MDLKLHTEPFPYITIRDTYTKEELTYIYQELEVLQSRSLFAPTRGAQSKDGAELKLNTGIWLDPLYAHNRDNSPLLRFNRKIFRPEILNQSESWFFRHFKPDQDFSLLSYYEDGDYYKPHCDSTCVTALTWFYKTPKAFWGGDLTFTEFNITIECQENFTVIFPAQVKHEVSTIKMSDFFQGQNFGRYCLSQFMSFST